MSKESILNVSELRQKNFEELNSELVKNKKEIFQLRFSLKSGTLEKTNEIVSIQ